MVVKYQPPADKSSSICHDIGVIQKGRFITFEGGEGAGKSTLIAELGNGFRARSVPYLVTREPGAGEFGRKIRELLLEGMDIPSISELFLFLADRANHVETIIQPALERGEIVLCDRYADSTFVYQAIGRELDPDFVRRANAFATSGLVPDLTILLDIDPSVGLQRQAERNRIDRESMEFHLKIRSGFLQLAKEDPSRWTIIDASQSKEAVFDKVLSVIPLQG